MLDDDQLLSQLMQSLHLYVTLPVSKVAEWTPEQCDAALLSLLEQALDELGNYPSLCDLKETGRVDWAIMYRALLTWCDLRDLQLEDASFLDKRTW